MPSSKSKNKIAEDINELIYTILDSDSNKLDLTELYKYLDGIKTKVKLNKEDILDDPDLTELISDYINKGKDKSKISNYVNKMTNFSIDNTYNLTNFNDMGQWTTEGRDLASMQQGQQNPYQDQSGNANLGIDPNALSAAYQDPNGSVAPQMPNIQTQNGQMMDPGMMQPQGQQPMMDPNMMNQMPQEQMMDPGMMQPQGQQPMMDPNMAPPMAQQPGIDPMVINQIAQQLGGQVDPNSIAMMLQGSMPMDPRVENVINQLMSMDPSMQGQPVQAVPQQQNQVMGTNSTPSGLPGQVIADESNFKAGMIPGERYTTAYVAFSVKNGYSVNLYKLPRNTKLTNFAELVKLPRYKSVKINKINDLYSLI